MGFVKGFLISFNMFVFHNFEIPLSKNLKNGLSLVFGVGRYNVRLIFYKLAFLKTLKLFNLIFIIDLFLVIF